VVSFTPTRRQILGASSALSLGIVAIAGVAVAASHRCVVLEVDGVSTPVSGFERTVGDVLAAQGVSVSAHDLVAPAADQSVADGQTIVVRTASQYKVMVDGEPVQAWSTGDSVDAVLDEVAGGGAVVMAADRSTQREALPVVTASGTLPVVADGSSHEVEAGPGDDVTSLLAKAGVTVGPIDRVAFSQQDGRTALTVTRVTRGERTETQAVPFPTEERDDDTLAQGTQQVLQEGRDGQVSTTYYEETVGGRTTVSVKVGESSTDPVSRILVNGTKEPQPAAAAASSSASSGSSSAGSAVGGDVWAALANCESGGNPATNTGNGFYGMYQFTLGTWQAMGGTGLPSEASAATQTAMAQRLQASAGWGQWPACAASLGLL
jgi:uncharacterized protein YabE (DUF348 family)